VRRGAPPRPWRRPTSTSASPPASRSGRVRQHSLDAEASKMSCGETSRKSPTSRASSQVGCTWCASLPLLPGLLPQAKGRSPLSGTEAHSLRLLVREQGTLQRPARRTRRRATTQARFAAALERRPTGRHDRRSAVAEIGARQRSPMPRRAASRVRTSVKTSRLALDSRPSECVRPLTTARRRSSLGSRPYGGSGLRGGRHGCHVNAWGYEDPLDVRERETVAGFLTGYTGNTRLREEGRCVQQSGRYEIVDLSA
jgi:hypothetical protein